MQNLVREQYLLLTFDSNVWTDHRPSVRNGMVGDRNLETACPLGADAGSFEPGACMPEVTEEGLPSVFARCVGGQTSLMS